MTDAYLNTPDKMSNETPLHFATKFLSVKAVEVLVSHPWCNLEAVNCVHETPFSVSHFFLILILMRSAKIFKNCIGYVQIIGSRGNDKAADHNEKRESVQRLFTDMYIVPIWRDQDQVRSPSVGPAAHVRRLGNSIPSCLLKSFPDFNVN